MRLSVKGRSSLVVLVILAWRGHYSAVIENVTGGLDVAADAVFIISQSRSVVVYVKPAVSCAQVVKLDP